MPKWKPANLQKLRDGTDASRKTLLENPPAGAREAGRPDRRDVDEAEFGPAEFHRGARAPAGRGKSKQEII